MIPKFRFWDKQECEFVPYLHNVVLKHDGTIEGIEYEMPHEGIVYNDISYFELLQSTRLKDKNGVEIFYGDIVKVSYKEQSYVSYITYEFHETTIEGKYIHEDFHYYENPLYIIFEDDDNDHTIEVIGNIYEHPHLLKE